MVAFFKAAFWASDSNFRSLIGYLLCHAWLGSRPLLGQRDGIRPDFHSSPRPRCWRTLETLTDSGGQRDGIRPDFHSSPRARSWRTLERLTNTGGQREEIRPDFHSSPRPRCWRTLESLAHTGGQRAREASVEDAPRRFHAGASVARTEARDRQSASLSTL